MSDNNKLRFSHSFYETINNINIGAKNFLSSLSKKVNDIDDKNDANNTISTNIYSLLTKINTTDLNPWGFYRNNLEPSAIKDIGDFIGTEETYLYLFRNSVYKFVNNCLSFIIADVNVKFSSYTTQLFQANAIQVSGVYIIFNKYLADPTIKFVNFLSSNFIFGDKFNAELKSNINSKIFTSEPFLATYLKDNASQEYLKLEDNIKDTLDYYGQNIANFITTIAMIPVFYSKYKYFSKQSPVIKSHLKLNSVIALMDISYCYFTDNYSKSINIDQIYKTVIVSANVESDQYNIENSLFVVGAKNLYSRMLMSYKFALNLAEQNYFIDALKNIINLKSVESIFSIYAAYKNSISLRTQEEILVGYANQYPKILVANDLVHVNPMNEQINAFLSSNAATFCQFNNDFYNQLIKIASIFIPHPDIKLKNSEIESVLNAVNSYKEDISQNNKIYQHGKNNKLVLSDLKIISAKTGEIIVNFAGGKLSIDMNPGTHYLWEGENSIGKSLLLKLIIGSSGGLVVTGNVFYPHGFTRSDISYVLQDDYYGVFKPLLHRLAAPKLLPADILSAGIDIGNVMSDSEFDIFVNSISNILFDMKYEKDWHSSSDAKKFLLDGYVSYQKTIETGGEKDFYDLVSSYDNQSGGHKKKLAIANAIYNKAKLILLDESFNAIDHDIKLTIYKLIDQYLPNSTILAIQHQVANHLIKEKESDENNKSLLANLKKIESISKLSEMHEIHKLISDILLNVEDRKISSEEMQFFHTIIKMSRIEDESENIVKNIFNITSLLKDGTSLASFSEYQEDVCYGQNKTFESELF